MKFTLLILITVLTLTGCTQGDVEMPSPVELTRENACAVCGMIVLDLPGSKAQIHYSNGKVDTFCCILHMFSFILQPDSPKNIQAIYVNDMGKADPEQPTGHWKDARDTFYIVGGDVMGPHGEAFVPFLDMKDAESYVKEHGGRIVRFNDVTPDMLRPTVHKMHEHST